MLNKKSILITGGTGSFGRAFIKEILKSFPKIRRLVIFSRDELKQFEMSKEFPEKKYPMIRYFIGDIRDRFRLQRAFQDIDIVIHAAALKQVPTAEYNPMEVIKTNINGSNNVISAAIENNIQNVLALSTDKASNPINLYGSTKLASDKLFIAGNGYSGFNRTKFSIVRYGNVMGSRGSIIPFLLSQKENSNYFTITDAKMTRFMTNLDSAVKLVWKVFEDMEGGEIYVEKNPSVKIIDIAKAIDPKKKIKFIGIRPGEKIHEIMISSDDSRYTYSYKDYFKILPSINDWNYDKSRIKKGKKVKLGFEYISNNNASWISHKDINKWIKSNSSDF